MQRNVTQLLGRCKRAGSACRTPRLFSASRHFSSLGRSDAWLMAEGPFLLLKYCIQIQIILSIKIRHEYSVLAVGQTIARVPLLTCDLRSAVYFPKELVLGLPRPRGFGLTATRRSSIRITARCCSCTTEAQVL